MRLRVIAITIIVITVLGGAWAGRALITSSSGGGWSHEAGEAWEAEKTLTFAFERGRPNVTFLVEATGGDFSDPDVMVAVDDFVGQLEARREIAYVESYWSLGQPEWLRSDDGNSALIAAWVPGESADYAARAADLKALAGRADTAIRVTVGGQVVVHSDIKDALESSLLPLLIVALLSLVLVLVFLRNVVATVLVAATSAFAVSATLLGLYGLSSYREMPLLSVVLGATCAWGLATGSGYLVISRFISERVALADRRDAVVATIGTAGRTVAIASGVVAAVGLSMWILPTTLLRSTSYALGLAGVASGASAVLGLGLLLAVVGVRVVSQDGTAASSLRVRPVDRVSKAVASRPVLAGVVAILLLAPLLPLGFSVPTGEPGPVDLSTSAPSRRVAQAIAADYPADDAEAPFTVARDVIEFNASDQLIAEYASSLSSLDDVVRTDSSQGSFADGEEITVPDEVTALYVGEEGTWLLAPVPGNPTGKVAHEVVSEIRATPSPFAVDVGGRAARETGTVDAIGGLAPFFAALAVIVTILLLAWLLRSVSAALRAALVVILLTAGAAVATWLGFSAGWFAPLLGFSTDGSVAAVAPALVWALSMGLAGASTIFAWGAVREVFDATGDPESAPVALAATRRNHLEATALLVVPFVPLIFTSWSTAQLLGVATVATGILVATVGRFVAMPVATTIAPKRLWPVDEDGEFRRVYPSTPACRHCITESAELAAAHAAEAEFVAARLAAEAEATEAAPDAELDDTTATAPIVSVVADDLVQPAPDVAASTTEKPAPKVAEPAPKAAAPKVVKSEPEVAESEVAESEVAAPKAVKSESEVAAPKVVKSEVAEPEVVKSEPEVAAPKVVKSEPEVSEPEVVESEPEVSEPEVSEPEVSEPEVVESEPEVAAPKVVKSEPAEPERAKPEPVDPAAVEPAAVQVEPVTSESEAVEGQAVQPAAVEPDHAKPQDVDSEPEKQDAAEPIVAAAETSSPVVAVAEPSAGNEASTDLAEPDEDVPSGPADGTVDVASLTESVIAAIEPGTPFTTELGSAYVANPANNLSRVMEAILRDATNRDGEEVLVYGHASRDRYRWMVVDSGPSSESDPTRAHTLAEAQRFIRRVGGVVECRPEGGFNVFVVEIPMAS